VAVPARLLVCSALAGSALASSGTAFACATTGYRYAGLTSPAHGHGIAATITPLSASAVSSGHIGAWVGVVGPERREAWLQAGVSGFPDRTGYELYYELRLPGAGAVYHRVAAGWPAGKAAHVAALEMLGRPGYWRVWVNGAPASPPVRLPSSALAAFATAESLDTSAGVSCNGFLYRFEHVAVARAPGGGWEPLSRGMRVGSAPARLTRTGDGSFLAALSG
jgi:hypothetical protein